MNTLLKKYDVPGPRYTSYPTIPYWDNEKFNLSLWKENVYNALNIMSSEEGISLYIHLPFCESLCTYCGCNTRITVNHSVELPYINAVLQEWNLYKRIFGRKPKIKEIHLGGGTPTFFSPENLFLLLEGILCGAYILDDAELSFEGHPDSTKEEHLRILYGLGFRRMSLGIQDFDPAVQAIINRKQSFEQVEHITSLARKIGYDSLNFDLIYGLPLQTIKGLENTFRKVELLRPDRIAFYGYAHVPWIKPAQRKFQETDLPDQEQRRKLYDTGKNILRASGYTEIGLDHFALPTDPLYRALQDKTLHRNFMGYTGAHTSTLIGLGCSSISDSWTAFAQNVKTVEEYIKEVNNGNLPISRGHILTGEDLILRRYILNILCKMETCLESSSVLVNIHEILNRLKGMEEDGLVETSDCFLKVTEKGRPFLRNICMAFDKRLQEQRSNKSIFSNTI